MSKVRLVQGNEACALGAIAAGATFYAGYPITPSTEVAEQIAVLFPKIGGKFIQMEDEIASIGAIIGASAAGHKSFTATSGPGFSLMQELIGYAAITEIPTVVIDVMRPGPSTGLPTLSSQGDIQQARWGTHGDHSIIALSPSSVMEAYYETIQAFNLAEKYRTPVVLLMDEEIGHLKERFEVNDEEKPEIINRKAPEPGKEYIPYENTEDMIPPFAVFGSGYRYHITGLTHGEKGFYSSALPVVDAMIRRLWHKIEDRVDDICRFEQVDTADAEILLIAYGSTARSAEEAAEVLRAEGIKAGVLRPITIWPFHDQYIAEICQGRKAIIVPEMNMGQYVREVQRVVQDVPVHSLTRVDGEMITPTEITAMVKEVL
ncbi:MAG: 2-oxoacid:acceptor oxidoreductase subunit alpha [Clostridiales bacterium]|jgi:2-oxoglutarate ferredoxin oxidoreductase subunit alpha|nr:2-oxoacid:acceptor oxidoreductase subunit alpha [Clostridiales bacterium]MDR2711973.1 2-oxoacid:acceptor oxidoreductase subunit alpha [Clostridiales bacterium]